MGRGHVGLTPERILRLEAGAVVFLDQRRLPDEEVELRCATAAEVAEAIRTLVVRGAPSIGIAAAYGYALAAEGGEDLDVAYAVLAESRPTAVNLVWALEQMRDDPSPEHARRLHEDEVERCKRMSAHAAELFAPGTRALTHCNAGGLATSGYGSAVGALRTAWERGLLERTLVITLGEFGRTPDINPSLGRDHFADAWSASLSGCGIQGGAVWGKTDDDGRKVVDGEVGAAQLFATIFQALGIDHQHEYLLGDRPIPLTDPGTEPIRSLLI